MNKQERIKALMPNNCPKWVRCYDNGGESFDRYTVVFTKKALIAVDKTRYFLYVGMSANPFHSQGFGQHGESNWNPIDRPTYGHLGKKISFTQLPDDCKKLVISDYKDLWDIK